ncbi:hypothetical protein [Streptomyces sp. HYC2]|uniref:hypothetical protein n=1 Tax=Streptomyces sp. HYC2 TaxID=2955207 RepID=UPI002480BC03|nr:hypothetical protein [Streptomyces sp. HYC2]
MVDQDGWRDESGHALVGAATLLAQWTSGAEFPGQGSAQAALGALVEGSVDAFVAQMPLALGMVGPAAPQMGGDLFRAPLLIELGLHLGSQLGIYCRLRATRTPGSFPAAVVGQVGVIDAVAVWTAVAPQLTADRRRRPAEPGSYLPDRQATLAQRGNPPAFRQG